MEKQVARTVRQSGITLLEIMIVLAIIGLVMGVLVGPKVFKMLAESRIRTTWMALKQFEGAYARWSADHEGEDCPSTLDDLVKYTANKGDTKDPWGQGFVIKCGDAAPTDSHFGVISLGPDKKEGTEDDIHSWDAKPKT